MVTHSLFVCGYMYVYIDTCVSGGEEDRGGDQCVSDGKTKTGRKTLFPEEVLTHNSTHPVYPPPLPLPSHLLLLPVLLLFPQSFFVLFSYFPLYPPLPPCVFLLSFGISFSMPTPHLLLLLYLLVSSYLSLLLVLVAVLSVVLVVLMYSLLCVFIIIVL